VGVAGKVTIKPGQEWGRELAEPVDVHALDGDAVLSAAYAVGDAGPFAVGAGDLFRAVGAPAGPTYRHVVPVDVLEVRLGGAEPLVAVAHVVARRPGRLGWWRGRIVAICNVDYLGEWNVAPRAHPNDGRADVVDVAGMMPLRARWQAWRRLPQGTHVPHPSISTRSVREATFQFDRPLAVWLDGVRSGTVGTLTVNVRPDAFELYI
jgi:hypothetical protein